MTELDQSMIKAATKAIDEWHSGWNGEPDDLHGYVAHIALEAALSAGVTSAEWRTGRRARIAVSGWPQAHETEDQARRRYSYLSDFPDRYIESRAIHTFLDGSLFIGPWTDAS